MRVSVVIASQGRPAALRRCLLALAQQFDPNGALPAFEVLVVSDAEGCRIGAAQGARTVLFTERNIAAARNAGILAAAGEVIAFIDDDAAAEPGWLAALTRPLADPQIAGAGGFVLGRNGISWQWRGKELDAAGRSFPLEVAEGAWSVPLPGRGRVVRVEGTNMAFRRRVLVSLGGFDPAFSFYHDETDLCWRLARAGHRLAIVPGAVVDHGVLASELRRADRMPRDLTRIGRSSALFLHRHGGQKLQEATRALRDEQRCRILSHMRAGRCMPGDVSRLLAGYDRGFAEGCAIAAGNAAADQDLRPLAGPGTAGTKPPRGLDGALDPAHTGPANPADFLAFQEEPPRGSVLIAGSPARARSLIDLARAERAAGKVVTLLLLGRSPRPHRSRFGDDGIWLQTGGLYGRSARAAPLWQRHSLASRTAAELDRLAGLRLLGNQAVLPIPQGFISSR